MNESLKRSESEDDNRVGFMREISLRILMATMGGALIFFAMNNLFKSQTQINLIISVLVVIVGGFLVYKARFFG